MGTCSVDGETSSLLSADSIVIAAGSIPENKLADEIKESVPEVHLIGGANKPGNALEAIKEGFLIGLEI